MTDFPVYIPPRPRPKPGSLPLDIRERPDSDMPEFERSPLTPWAEEPQPTRPPKPQASFTKLKAARKKVEALATVVRDEGFDEWVRRCLVHAERPDEWTPARELYENYIERTKRYGQNRGNRALSKQELASETQWGKMMGALFTKKRRRAGLYYPLRLKRGA